MPEPNEKEAFEKSVAVVGGFFLQCTTAIDQGKLIKRESRSDKEFHFQNWVKARLDETKVDYDEPGRNTYPDFRLVHTAVGYEVKGVGFPGRENNYDCNSQLPHGVYHGRQVVYVFGRYPSEPEGTEYAVHDLVFCHGSFLNAYNDYEHVNESTRGFGSYGDILLRDRKMYVAPTPYALLSGLDRESTLVIPSHWNVQGDFKEVGRVIRREVDRRMSGYSFSFETNTLEATYTPNPSAGREHEFSVHRLTTSKSQAKVELK